MKSLLFFMLICTVYSKIYLTKKQWFSINKIIKHPSSTTEMKYKIHKYYFFIIMTGLG